MRTIKLARGIKTKVDDALFDYLNQWRWHLSNGKVVRQGKLSEGYSHPRPTILMHRVVLEKLGIKIDGLEVDHINHDTLDNQTKNLRPATTSQNQANRKMSSNNTSGVKGVYLHTKNKNWVARIKVGSKIIHIGCFVNIEDAREAYDKKAVENFGEYALTNKKIICAHA